jgi:hypothetical protein
MKEELWGRHLLSSTRLQRRESVVLRTISSPTTGWRESLPHHVRYDHDRACLFSSQRTIAHRENLEGLEAISTRVEKIESDSRWLRPLRPWSRSSLVMP